jgi:hypothetical protein
MPPEEAVPPPAPHALIDPAAIDPAATDPAARGGYAATATAAPGDPGHPDAEPERTRRLAPLGLIAFVTAAVLAVAEGVAIYLGSLGQYAAATVLAQVLVVLTAVPLALGLYAVVRRRNRDWGIAAMVVALAANPLVLSNLLDFFGTL